MLCISFHDISQSNEVYLEVPTSFLSYMQQIIFGYMVGWFVVCVYGISTIVGYLMPNPFYTCIPNTFCR